MEKSLKLLFKYNICFIKYITFYYDQMRETEGIHEVREEYEEEKEMDKVFRDE